MKGVWWEGCKVRKCGSGKDLGNTIHTRFHTPRPPTHQQRLNPSRVPAPGPCQRRGLLSPGGALERGGNLGSELLRGGYGKGYMGRVSWEGLHGRSFR